MSVPIEEEWRVVPGWPDYEVSNLGRVVSHRRAKPCILKPGLSDKGYPQVGLTRDGKATTKRVHTLVATAFIGPRPDGQEVRHLDGCRTNAALSNLAYGTSADNEADKLRHGTHVSFAPRCRLGHVVAGKNAHRDDDGVLRCRRCVEMADDYYARKAAM